MGAADVQHNRDDRTIHSYKNPTQKVKWKINPCPVKAGLTEVCGHCRGISCGYHQFADRHCCTFN